MRPHVITLGYSELARSRRFYEEGLGFKAAQASQDDIVFYATGGAVLALYPRELLAEDARISADGTGFSGITLATNVERKEEVAEILGRAEHFGGKILKSAQDVFWGGHSGYFADPDGHLWEVAWNPYFEFDAQGNVALE